MLVGLLAAAGCLGPARALHDDTLALEVDAGAPDAGVIEVDLVPLVRRYVGDGTERRARLTRV